MVASDILRSGAGILSDFMTSRGFVYIQETAGRSSGGNFASGAYVRRDRKLEIHYRHSLGLVSYHIGTSSLRHETLMRALLGPEGGNHYPGFSDDPMDAFRDLLHDLEHFAADFLSGPGQIFKQCVLDARAARRLNRIERLEQRWPNSVEEAS
jgi:hypothetical protein